MARHRRGDLSRRDLRDHLPPRGDSVMKAILIATVSGVITTLLFILL
jgi:hypothetical protein